MADNGWYPDPSGAKGRFRYWDGSTWSEETTTDPHNTPPPSPDAPDVQRAAGGRGWIIALLVLALITAIVIVAVLWNTGGVTISGGGATEDTNSSTPTVSSWDETSTPSTKPPPPTDSGGELVACPYTLKTGNTTQTAGKLRASTLSVSTIPGWRLQGMNLDSVYDLHAQIDSVYPGWMSNIAVGLLSHEDGFVEIARSAQQMMQCFASSGYYRGFTSREDLIAGEQINVSGRPAWHIRANIFVTGERVPGDVVDIIIVDLGVDKDHLGIFFSSCSIGDEPRCSQVRTAINTLAVG